jgi:RNA polymerase sigma-70 factor (ECF subfamily)
MMGEAEIDRTSRRPCVAIACTDGPCAVLARTSSGAAAVENPAALAAFCEASWPVVRAAVCAQGYRGADAEDLTQAYFARFVERGDLGYAAAWKGCALGFLRVSVRSFLANQRDRERARKRGGGVRPLSLDTPRGERETVPEPASRETPETLLAERQADQAIRTALEQLRIEMEQTGCAARLARLEAYLLTEVNKGSYGRMAKEWGVGESAARVTLHRLRRRLASLLRGVISAPPPHLPGP